MEVIGYKRGNIDCNDYFSASLQKFTVIKNWKLKDVLEHMRNIGENDKWTMDWKQGNLEQYKIENEYKNDKNELISLYR